MKNYCIALIPGDGIGKEVIPAAAKVVQGAPAGRIQFRD
jgi:isocitrate/isopropylmalate dehydrogenase